MAANGNAHNMDPNVQIIVNDFMCAQLLLKGYEWTPIEANNGSVVMDASMRTKVGDALRSLGEAYVNLYQQNFAEMLERLQLSPNAAFATFQSVSNELYIEGIKWSHIITHLVFASEFALNCAQQGFPHLVNEVAHWLALYINEHLLQWIADHGGWEGVIEFSRQIIDQPQGNGHWRFGLKDIICGAAGALGVITLGLFLTTKS